jgi:hypothetical protein
MTKTKPSPITQEDVSNDQEASSASPNPEEFNPQKGEDPVQVLTVDNANQFPVPSATVDNDATDDVCHEPRRNLRQSRCSGSDHGRKRKKRRKTLSPPRKTYGGKFVVVVEENEH